MLKTNRKRKNKAGSPNHQAPLTYAIGDIHGRADLLTNLLSQISDDIAAYKSKHGWIDELTIVFLGDYIDRGHQSRQVIETLRTLEIGNAKFIFLKGNHEEAALEFMHNADAGQKWIQYGGTETLASYGINLPTTMNTLNDWEKVRQAFVNTIPPLHLLFLRTLKSFHIKGEYMFVHAGIDPDKPLREQTDKDYLWIREPFLNSLKKLPYIVVHGHTPEPSPVWDGRRIGIDTGAYMSNTLTAARIEGDNVSFLTT